MALEVETISTIIGFILFALSEILPLINIPANGLIHSLILGVSNSFKSPEQDIELAHSLITTQPNFASIINVISSNPQIKSIVTNLVHNPSNANNISTVQTNSDISNLVSIVSNNQIMKSALLDPKVLASLTPNIIEILPTLQKNLNLLDAFKIPEVMNNISQLLTNPQLSVILNKISQDPNLLLNVTNLITV